MHLNGVLSAASVLLVSHTIPSLAAPTGSPSCGYTPPSPTLPSSSLPAPSTGLIYVALGLGTQNYTCASPSAVPVAAGALANIYDITSLASQQGMIGQMAIAQGPCYADRANSAFGLRQLGMHYFNSAGAPTFDLTMAGAGEYLQAKKMAVANAPSGACAGRSGDAAVPWLFLAQDGTGRSTNVGSVYRVETAGGSAVSCSDVSNGWITRDYAAEYWFYQ